MSINDCILEVTGGNQVNDALYLYFGGTGGESLTDAEYRWLMEQGASAAPVPDMWYEFLTGLGYTGHLNDMYYQYWCVDGEGSGWPDTAAFIAAFRGSTNVQNVGVDGTICNLMPKGDITATSVHNAIIMAPDTDGVFREYAIDTPVWKSVNYDLDPAQLFWEATVTVDTPASITQFRITYSDGSTHRMKYVNPDGSYVIGDSVASDITNAERHADGTVMQIHNGSLFGGTNVTKFQCYSNKLAGTITGGFNLPNMVTLYLHDNQLTGSLPSFDDIAKVVQLYFHTNQFTGNVPSLSSLSAVTQVYLYNNLLTGYDGGWPNRPFYLHLLNNALTEAAVNLILTEADTFGVATGTTINMSGGTNAAPTGVGITAKNNLIANGATVTTN